MQQTYFDSSTQTLVINDNFKTTLKCRENNTIIKSTQSYQQQQQQDARTVECNNELRGLNLIEYKCLNVCNVNYLVNLMRNQENIGKFYPINPLNQYYLNHEPMRFYCNSVDYDRKVVLFECVNTNWRLATRNEMVTNERQIVNECVYTDDGNDESDDDGTTANSSHFSNIEYYFRKNFKNLLNLKLNLKLFLIILLVSSALIILFLMMLLLITFYKRYRLTNYYRSLFTQRHSSLQVQQQQQRASRRCSSSLLNNLLRSFRRQQNQQSLRRYEDQITFSIGSSSSLNNQNNNNCALATQNLILPSYDEATNKPVQMSEGCQQPAETTTVLHPPSPPPSFSAISKEVSNVVQSCNDNTNTNNNNISNIDDSQSNYSSISAAPALMLNNKRIIKQLKFSSSNSHHYLQNQQSFYDSNETFSLNSGIAIANAIGTSEVCTIVTNDSAESNASKFVLRGSFDNNIDQTSLLNYSTSLSDAILHNEGNFNFNSKICVCISKIITSSRLQVKKIFFS